MKQGVIWAREALNVAFQTRRRHQKSFGAGDHFDNAAAFEYKESMFARLATSVVALSVFVFRSPQRTAVPSPLTDHHQHLFSPEASRLSPRQSEMLDAAGLVALLDSAGIARAVILSVAYQFGNPNRPPIENEYEKVKAENDWTSAQVHRFPNRLRGFCGVNPLKSYALEEIARCARDPMLRTGLKLHFGNSDVDLDNPVHREQLRRVFAAANANRMAIVIHMRSSVTMHRPYGAREVHAFLDDVLPSAPDVIVQIAHLAGAGEYDDSQDAALSVFVNAVARHDRRMAHVLFDVSGEAGYGDWKAKARLIASRIRQLGMQRILFGADGSIGDSLKPREAWQAFLELPLLPEEFRVIAENVAPYLN